MRIALCTNYVSPYRLPMYRELSNRDGWDVTIFTSSDSGHDREWGRYDQDGTIRVQKSRSFSYRTIASYGKNGNKTSEYEEATLRSIPLGLVVDLIKFRPDVIITGELGMRTVFAYIAGFLTRTPVIPWTYPSRAKISIGLCRRWTRRVLLRSAPAIIGMGKTAREMLVSEGADSMRIFNAPNAADLDSLRESADQYIANNHVERVRAVIGFEKRIALVVGRLVEMKAPFHIRHAWALLPNSLRDQWELVYIGDGPLKKELAESGMPGVRLIGTVPPNEVAHWLKACDLHIFASLGDPWGLVVNESMHLGKPTLCSKMAGCCDDLIVDGITGFEFDPGLGLAEFATKLTETLLRDDLAKIGHNAQIHAASFTPKRMADGIAHAIESVLPSNGLKAHLGGAP